LFPEDYGNRRKLDKNPQEMFCQRRTSYAAHETISAKKMTGTSAANAARKSIKNLIFVGKSAGIEFQDTGGK